MAEEQIAGGGTPKPLEQFYLDIKDHVDVPDTYAEFEKVMSTGNNLQTFYDQIKGDIDVPKDFATFKSTLLPAVEAGKKKDDTVSSSADTSSDLLSVNFGGEKYDVNPKTQEVFKGGKPVQLDQPTKDYIAKNILGVEQPTQQVGAIGADGQAMQPIGATGAVTDKLATEAIQKGLTGAEGETKQPISSDVRNVLDKNFIDVRAFDRADPAILDQAAKDLTDYTGIKVDLKYPETLDKAIGQAKILRDVNAFDKMAKDAGMTPQKAVDVAYDFGAQKFLNGFDKDLFALDKQAKEAFANGDKATIEKLKPQYEKLRKAFVAGYDDEITDLQTELLTKVSKDGKPLFPTEIADKQNQLNLLKKQRNGFFQTPDQVIKGLGEGDSDVSALDKQLQGKSPMEQLQIIAKAKTARYMLLGNKLGIKPSDILTEGNIRNMTVGGLEDKGLVNWSIDNIKNYMGYGDLNGEVTSNDRKEFAKLHGELKSIMPILLINKTPIEAAEDNSGDIFLKTASQFAPATKAQNMTGQQVATTIQDVLSQANISNNALTPDAVESMDKKLKEYGFKQSLAQMGGQTAQIIIPMMVSSGLTGSALEALALSPRTAAVTRFLLNNPLGKVIKGAGEYGLAGKIANDTSELDLGTGATAGAVDAALDAFGGRFKLLKPWLRLKFGANAGKAANLVARTAAKGLGGFVQESGETLYQAWRDTPEGKSTMDTLQQQFGDLDDIVKFAVGTIVMGSGMSLSSELGFDKARLDAVSRMNPEQRAKFDAAVKYFKDKDNAAQQGAIDEVLPTAKTDVIQDSLKDTTEAISKLQTIADNVQSEDEVIPYSVTVNGVTYSGTTPAELRADIDYLDYINNKSNDELYKRNTGQTEETPTNTEQVQQQPIAEESVGVESPINAAEQPETVQNAQENGQEETPIQKLENEYTAKSVDELIALKKKLYGDVDIETAMSPEEKLLDRVIAKKFSDKNAEIIAKRNAAKKLPQGGEVKETVSEKQVSETPTDKELDDYYDAIEEEKKNVIKDARADIQLKGGETIPYKNAAIHAAVGSRIAPNEYGGNISKESFERFADPNLLIGDSKDAIYLRKMLGINDSLDKGMNRKVTKELDTFADEISEKSGVEITPQDIVEYLLDRSKRPEAYRKAPNKAATAAKRIVDTNSDLSSGLETLGRLGTFADDFNIDDPAIQGELAFLFDEGDLNNLKEYINHLNLPENAEQKREVQKRLQGDRDVNNAITGGKQVESRTGQEETTPTQKVNEQGSPIGESPQDVTGNIGTDKDAAEKTEGAIPTEVINDLLGDANKRRNAKKALPTETIKETAAVILKDSDIEAIFQRDTDESIEILMKLQEKLGIKKIC